MAGWLGWAGWAGWLAGWLVGWLVWDRVIGFDFNMWYMLAIVGDASPTMASIYHILKSKPITLSHTNQPTSQPANQPAQPAQPSHPATQPTSHPVTRGGGSVSYLTKVAIIGGCRRDPGSSQKRRVLLLSFDVHQTS